MGKSSDNMVNKLMDKITKYLTKCGHENIITMYLDGYNGNNILVRLDYVKSIASFKIVWIDLNFIDLKKIDKYINMQIITKYLANRFMDIIDRLDVEPGTVYNDDILGDRVNLYIKKNKEVLNYNFDRFLPSDWSVLAELIVILFSYLPRNMECFLNEMFGILDGLEDAYNVKKPIKIDIYDDDDIKKYFKPVIINRGKKYFEDGKVIFLDKIDNRYIALVDGTQPYAVIVDHVAEGFYLLWCNCAYNGFCKHIYAVILAIRNKQIKKFYKVRRVNDKSLLENITNIDYELSVGVAGDNILIITNDGQIISEPIMDGGKSKFQVIEDDLEMSLSTYIEKLVGDK